MHDPFYLLRQIPDHHSIRLWFGRLTADRRTDSILSNLADILEELGITLIDSTTYISDHLAPIGPMTGDVTDAVQQTIDLAVPIVRRMGDLDVGQSIAALRDRVITVEGIEGTDAMIERAGALSHRHDWPGWTLLKMAKPQQDMRFDVPTVGIQTIENLHTAHGRCLALEAGKVILLDRPAMITRASELGISMIGIEKSAG